MLAHSRSLASTSAVSGRSLTSRASAAIHSAPAFVASGDERRAPRASDGKEVRTVSRAV
jgi:hypothetical protein